MTVSELVGRIERAAPRVGYLIESVVKKQPTMDRPEVFFSAWLYLPGKSVHVIEATPRAVWSRFRAELGLVESWRPAVDGIDVPRLARRERA